MEGSRALVAQATLEQALALHPHSDARPLGAWWTPGGEVQGTTAPVLRVWVVTPASLRLGLRAWSDVSEGQAVVHGQTVAWVVCDVERGLREMLRQSLGSLETMLGACLPRQSQWMPQVWFTQLEALMPGAVTRGAATTLCAAARGLHLQGEVSRAMRLGLIASRLMREGVLAEACPQVIEGLAMSASDLELLLQPARDGRELPERPVAYHNLDKWLRGLRLETLV